ncbi:MAG: PQQ-binding-like beta-propeller repeat protein [Planctomycetes bacterium]|nr:PQQ-binding-like beta-propeller repeat protein [Planctomycetota bacterium]
MQLKRTLLLGVLIAGLSFNLGNARAENWPGWRGTTGVGYSTEKDLPLTWNAKSGENVRWKVPLGGVGNSSPIVWGNKIFVTTSAKQTREDEAKKIVPAHHLVCLDVAEGKQLWRTEIPAGEHPEGYDIYAVPTPVTDGERVYVWYGSGVVAAADMDGKLVWRKERTGPLSLNPGLCSSPIVYEDTVILYCDQGRGQGFLQALDKKTGDVKWEQKRKEASYNNTTPILIKVNDKTQMVIASSKGPQGLDPTDGKIIWNCAANGFGASPAFRAGLLYMDSGANGASLVVDTSGQGDVSKTHVKWKHDKVSAEYSSPIIVGDYVYRTRKPGVIVCWKLSTGEEVFDERVDGISILASPIATADDRIYFAASGKSYVIKAGPKLEILAQNDLGGGTTGASPAISGGKIYIRDREFLYCIGRNPARC